MTNPTPCPIATARAAAAAIRRARARAIAASADLAWALREGSAAMDMLNRAPIRTPAHGRAFASLLDALTG